MIDMPDLQALRAWQARNRQRLYVYGGAFFAVLLIANLMQIFGG